MLFILLPNGVTAGKYEHNGKPEEFTIADGVLSFRRAGSGDAWMRHKIISATEGDTLTEYVCAASCKGLATVRERLELYEATIATATALLQAAERAARDEASPEEFLRFLLQDRAAGIEPPGAVLRLARSRAEDQACGVATPPIAETFRDLALAELVEALAAIEAQR
jgi:hypothetical protein